MDSKKKFIPICFKKDIEHLNTILTHGYKNDNKIMTKEINFLKYSNLSYNNIFLILRNLQFTLNKCLNIEYSKQRLKVKEINKILELSKNSDVYSFTTIYKKYFNLLEYEFKFKLLRYFSSFNKDDFILFKVLDENDPNRKYCKGGILFSHKSNIILIYLKKSKKLQNKKLLELLDKFEENLKIVLEVMNKIFFQDDVNKIIEKIENLELIQFKKENTNFILKTEQLISMDNFEVANSQFSYYINTEQEDSYINTIIDFDDLDLDFINFQSDLILIELLKSKMKFLIDEDDEDYKIIKVMNESDLEKLNLLESFNFIKNELENEIKEKVIKENELVRYVYGWRGDVDKLKTNISDLIKWRNEYKPEKIILRDFLIHNYEENLKNLMSVDIQDIYGRPFILITVKYLIPKKIEIDVFIKFLIFNMEKAILMMPSNIDKLAIIIDLKDASFENIAINYIKTVKELTSKFYVELLSKIILINKGYFFSMVWKLISNVLDERTLKKIIVIDQININWLKRILPEESFKKLQI